VKNIALVSFVFLFAFQLRAIEVTADLFYYDENKIQQEFKELNALDYFLKEHPDAETEELVLLFPSLANTLNNSLFEPFNQVEILAPGRFPSFWFTFALSAIGTYFIYGAVAGPIAVGIVYFNTNKDKNETKKAIWGCVTGTLLGAGIKYAMMNL